MCAAELQSLVSFAASKNCFDGVLSEDVCNARNLEVLSLDGFNSGLLCSERHRDFVATPTPAIPTCLWELPSLGMLHLSSILYAGVLEFGHNRSSAHRVGPQAALKNLSLSHNRAVGTIPVSVFNHMWFELDLSFNRFDGHLGVNISLQGGGSARLGVNRLSGVRSCYCSMSFWG